MVRLLLVEDYILFRGALAVVLDRQPDLEVAAQCGSLVECRSLGGFADIDVALLDLLLPDGDSTELIGVLRGANPRLKVLILTASPEPGLLERMAEPGADGVLDKTSGLKEIVAEVRRLASGANDNES
jgi:two-component system, NarL family, response regulator DesR